MASIHANLNTYQTHLIYPLLDAQIKQKIPY